MIRRKTNANFIRYVLAPLQSLHRSINYSVYSSTLAATLSLPLNDGDIMLEKELILQRSADDKFLELVWGPKSNIKESPFRIDFQDFGKLDRLKQSANTELLCKAIGKSTCVVDMTSGIGRDSAILASGLPERCVVMCERTKVLYFLVKDAIERLRIENPQLSNRMILENIDSAVELVRIQQLLVSNNQSKISVYLDPMYPSDHTSKRKAKSKKETQFLHRLVPPFVNTMAEEANNQMLFQVLFA